MSGAPRRRCPVCWQTIFPTTHRMISRHWDSVGRDICPGSGEPYMIATPGRRRVLIDAHFLPLPAAGMVSA